MPALVLGSGDGGHVGGPRGGRVLGVQGVGVRATAGGLLVTGVTVHTDISQGAGGVFHSYYITGGRSLGLRPGG